LDNVIKPYVKKDKFLLILDSWGGQINPAIYDEKFVDENDEPTCSLKIIPPKCTPLCQPCDVYFYKQVKNYIAKFQNCPVIIAANRELSSREDCIDIHALIHNQLQAPIYRNMVRYAWYAAKLITSREVFGNVNQVAFLAEVKTEKCECSKQAFVRCSWCRKYFCFGCIYDEYYPESCKPVTVV
jgi:hypothetical protein